MEPSESKYFENVSYEGKDGDISPPEKLAKATSHSAPHSPSSKETVKSSSSGQESQGSVLSASKGTRYSPSAPNAQEISQSFLGNLALLLSSQGPHKPSILTKQMLHFSTSTQEFLDTLEPVQYVGTHQFSKRFMDIYFLR